MGSGFFESALAKARTRDLSVVDLIGTVERLRRGGEAALALELYRIWFEQNADNPLNYAVLFNYGVALNDAGAPEAAKDAFEKSIALNAGFIPSYINLGSSFERFGALDDAVARWNHVVQALAPVDGNSISYKATALKQIGRVLENANRDDAAEQILRQGLEIDKTQRDAIQHLIALRQRQCKWPAVEPFGGLTRAHLMRSMSPLSAAVLFDDPMLHLATSHSYNRNDVGRTEGVFTAGGWAQPENRQPRKLRIAYVSSDLRDHAVGFLTTELFGLHDREKVEVFAYYSGIKANDGTQARIKNTVDQWLDITALSDKDAARRMIADEIDIIIDLNGYTKDARTKLFALKPAPIIVNWLGFPGSTGSAYHHYVIADDTIIPPELEIYYSEKVLRLPCYQPTDRQRIVAAERPTRQELGLPETGIVYCGFNGMQKITPPVFARWMQILREVPDSVLWLLAASEESHTRLRERAEDAGIAKERLIFAGRKRNPDHMARYALADIFLDTFPYGAHTTASDALWMGVPVVTLPGLSFASRVCGSLVRAAGLGDLVCETGEDYVAKAVSLGRNPSRLAHYKSLLREGRDRSVLFDTPLLVRKLEGLFASMWEDYAAGRLPQPDLTNLPLYHDIGCDEPEALPELMSHDAYQAHYRHALTYRNSSEPLPRDGRLWAEETPQKSQKRRAA